MAFYLTHEVSLMPCRALIAALAHFLGPVLWELVYAPSIGHPARLSGRVEVIRHATWFVGAVENFRFFDLSVYALADPEGAVAEVKAEGFIKPTGRSCRQDYVVFLRGCRRQDRVFT